MLFLLELINIILSDNKIFFYYLPRTFLYFIILKIYIYYNSFNIKHKINNNNNN